MRSKSFGGSLGNEHSNFRIFLIVDRLGVLAGSEDAKLSAILARFSC
jgi:hypothetical protein